MSEGEEEAEHPLNEFENPGDSEQNGSEIQLFHPEEGIEYVEVNFQEGPLGVTLRRRPDGIVYVHDLVEGSQAMDIDVKMNDKIAVVGSRVIDGIPLDKGQWDDLIDMIKKSSRPLRVVLKREMDENLETTSQYTAHIDDEQSSQSHHRDHNSSDNGPEDEMNGKPNVQGGDDGDDNNDSVHDMGAEKPEISINDGTPAPLPEEDPVVLQELEIMRNIQMLEELSEKMFFNEKEKATTSILSFVHRKVTDSPQKRVPIDFLVKRGRKLLISSEVSVIIKGVPTERMFFLFNDLLVTAIVVVDMFQVEHVIDLQVCKVHFGLSKDKDDTLHLPPELSSPREAAERCFEVQWPRGTLQVLCASPAEREDWVQCLLSAIWGCVDDSGHVLGWRHQYVSGTMHAAVITRDEMRVREMLAAYQSDQLSRTNIDEVDDDGYTALHYACILRLHSIIRSLHHAGAEVTVADKRGFTPLHWAALQLDIISLIILCTNMFNPDIEDHQGRTPLFLACVEGRDVGGKSDPESLKRCIATLLGIHSDPNVRDRSNVALLHYMAASWQVDATKLLIEASADVMARGGTEGRTALHYAAAASPVKRATGEGTRIMAAASVQEVSSSSSLAEVLRPENGAPTLKLLLGVGSRPNWRDVSGRSALHLIALNEQMWGRELPEAVAALVECGARLDDGALCQLLRSKCAGVPAGSGTAKGGAQGQGSILDAALDAWTSKGAQDGDALGLSLNSLECSEDSKICYPRDGKEKCILCSALFTMFRRRHHCRLCGILCCDDCSRKKVTIGAAQRVCDGCFNYVYQRAHIATEALANDPLARLQARHSASKSELFGSAGTKGNVGPNRGPGGGGADAAINSLSEAHDRLLERGEKLSKLSDKTAAMASASQDFEKMARQLKEQQKSSWF